MRGTRTSTYVHTVLVGYPSQPTKLTSLYSYRASTVYLGKNADLYEYLYFRPTKKMPGRGRRKPTSKSSSVWDAASRGDTRFIATWCAGIRSIKSCARHHPIVRGGGIPRRRGVVHQKTRRNCRCRAGDIVVIEDCPKNIDCLEPWTGWTPLMLAVSNNHFDTVRILLSAGASPEITADDVKGQTALHIACTHGRFKLLKMLMTVSPRGVFVKDKLLQTCLHAACEANRLDILRWILRQDATEDHSLVSVIREDEIFEDAVTEILEEHRKIHKDQEFMIRAKKMRAELGF